jgi:hypothetical protein
MVRSWLIAVLLPAIIYGAEEPSTALFSSDCIEELQTPEYPLLGRQGKRVGSSIVVFTIRDKRAIDVVANSTERLLQRATAEALRESRFKASCENRSFSIQFVFELYEPNANSSARSPLILRMPNIVVVRAPFPQLNE